MENLTANDVVYTPREIARQMIAFYTGDLVREFVLDPCRGDGAFYDQYPNYCQKEWCEITEGRDFLIGTSGKIGLSPIPLTVFTKSFAKRRLKLQTMFAFLFPCPKSYQVWVVSNRLWITVASFLFTSLVQANADFHLDFQRRLST